MLRSVLSLFACILATMASTMAAAQTIRFTTTTAHPGDLVTLDVWYEAGGGAVGFDFVGRFEPSLQIAGFRPGNYASTQCNVIASENELRIIGVEFTLVPLPDHRACSVDLRVSPSAAAGWHGLVFDDAQPSFFFADAKGNKLPGHLDGGGVFVIDDSRAGTCSLIRQDMPSPDFVPEFAPVCHCLRSADHPLHRCGIRFGEDFVLWREFPAIPDPSDWAQARWTLLPLREGLPDIVIYSESLSGQVWADAAHFDAASTPLKARSLTTGFKLDDPKALDRLQVQVKFDGHAYQFEQRQGEAGPK